jgi:hypothetical protein
LTLARSSPDVDERDFLANKVGHGQLLWLVFYKLGLCEDRIRCFEERGYLSFRRKLWNIVLSGYPGSGKTVSESREKAYKNLDKIELPNSPMYRTDIGCRLESQLPELQKHGFCDSWKY